MHQDTKHQHIAKYADTMLDLQEPKSLPPPNIELCKAEGSLPLVPKLPNFKHTSPSIMLGYLVQGLQTLGCQETTQDHDAKEALQTTNFHSLEYKLREYIWTLALPQTRIIELAKSKTYSVHSSAGVPALLHTCRESRAIALNHYNLSFSSTSTLPKVYFDFKYDWLYTRCSGCIGMDCTHKLTLTDDHKKLKGLVFEGPMTYDPFPKILDGVPLRLAARVGVLSLEQARGHRNPRQIPATKAIDASRALRDQNYTCVVLRALLEGALLLEARRVAARVRDARGPG